ncbi:MAG: hypothetical protein ACRCSV_05290 [Chlamydiales bacterium]
MTSDWKSTIHNAYTNPEQLHLILQQTIPSLIKDEIQRLANLILFQNNVQSRADSLQVPVDMKFTGDSLNIRISKNAPWISLLPSSQPMSPEEKAVDAVRRDVMQKIALLWGGVSNGSSTESDSVNNSTFEPSRGHRKAPERTRSKRSKRAEKNKKPSSQKEPFTRISRNKIDCSTHTTNNYYCCVGSHDAHSNRKKENTQAPRGDMNTQTDPIFNPLFKNQNIFRNNRERGSSEDSSSDKLDHGSTGSFSSKRQMRHKSPLSPSHSNANESEDSSSDKSDHGSTGSFSSKRQMRHKPPLPPSHSNANESEDSSSDKSDHGSTGSFSSKRQMRHKSPLPPSHSNANESEDSSSDKSDQTDSTLFMQKRGTFSKQLNTEPMPTLRPIPSKADDSFAEIKKFIQTYNTESKPVSHLRAFLELQVELTQEKPNEAKINNLLSILKADALQIGIETPQTRVEKFVQLEKITSSAEFENLERFLKDSIKETNAFIEIVNSVEEDLAPETISSLLRNRDILINIQNLLDFPSPLTISSDRVNSLLHQLDLTTLQLIHHNSDLEIPFIDEDFDDQSIIVGSVIENSTPKQIDASIQRDTHQTDEEIELLEKLQELSARFEELATSISLTVEKSPTASATTQSDDYRTDKEIKLQKKVQFLSKKYENLAGTILKQSKVEEKQQANIRELQFDLARTKDELVVALRRFETLAESTETKFKIAEDQSEYIRNLERELEQSQQLLMSITTPKINSSRFGSKKISSETQVEDNDFIEDIENTPLSLGATQKTEDTDDLSPLVKTQVQAPVSSESEDGDEGISELLNQYQELNKDLQRVKKDDASSVEGFYKKYANSGIHTQLNVLVDHLRFNQDPLNPSRDIVLKRRQDTLDMFYLFDKNFSQEVSDDSGNETDKAAGLLELSSLEDEAPTIQDSAAIENPQDNTSIRKNTVVANASTQSEQPNIADASRQNEKPHTTDIFTQVKKTPLTSVSTQAGRATANASTQVNNQTEKEFELQLERDDFSRRFEKLAERAEKQFKSVEEQLEYTSDLETQVQALEDINKDLIATINAFNKRNIIPKVKEDSRESQSIEAEDTETDIIKNKELETDSSLQVETSPVTFNDLPPRIKTLFKLYEKVTNDLTEIQYSSSSHRFYEEYKESNVIADLKNFAKSLKNIDPISDVTLPSNEEIDSLSIQVQQILLQEKELEEAELAEHQTDFDQRLKIYNQLTSDLQKFQKKQTTLAELYQKYANANAMRELEIFARQERNIPPSKISVEKKISDLRELLIKFDNDPDSTDL